MRRRLEDGERGAGWPGVGKGRAGEPVRASMGKRGEGGKRREVFSLAFQRKSGVIVEPGKGPSFGKAFFPRRHSSPLRSRYRLETAGRTLDTAKGRKIPADRTGR